MRISVHDSHFGCEEYHLGYSGRLPSGGADDIVVRGTFVENNAEPGAAPLASESKLTSVRVELEAVYVAPENASQEPTVSDLIATVNCHSRVSLS